MKRGILVLSLFLISILAISGCVQRAPSGEIDQSFPNSDEDYNLNLVDEPDYFRYTQEKDILIKSYPFNKIIIKFSETSGISSGDNVIDLIDRLTKDDSSLSKLIDVKKILNINTESVNYNKKLMFGLNRLFILTIDCYSEECLEYMIKVLNENKKVEYAEQNFYLQISDEVVYSDWLNCDDWGGAGDFENFCRYPQDNTCVLYGENFSCPNEYYVPVMECVTDDGFENTPEEVGDIYVCDVDAWDFGNDPTLCNFPNAGGVCINSNQENDYCKDYKIRMKCILVPPTPNDELFPDQWALDNSEDVDIDAPEAWTIEKGEEDIIIAVIDTGIDYMHEDLGVYESTASDISSEISEFGSIWINSVEDLNSNGIFDEADINNYDDDGNGFIDDVIGWDFVNEDVENCHEEEDCMDPDNDPFDYQGHGTLCSGLVSANTNNGLGIAGTCRNCKVMSIRAGYMTDSGGGSLSIVDVISSVEYAVDNGARIISMSWGTPSYIQSLKDVLDYAFDENVVLVSAAGNENRMEKSYPAGYDSVIGVSALNNFNDRAYFSNFGSWIDIAAPGEEIYSTGLDNGYIRASGTSLSSPIVAGVAGLILSNHPEFTNKNVIQVLRSSVDPVNSVNYIGRGRLNAYNALQINEVSDVESEITYPEDSAIFTTLQPQTISVAGTSMGDSYVVYYGEGAYPTIWTEIGSGIQVEDNVLAILEDFYFEEGTTTIKLVTTDGVNFVEDFVTVYAGMYLEGWPKTINEEIHRPISVGDIDGDGDLEIIVSINYKIYAWNHDGSDVPGWPITIPEQTRQTPALADLDGNPGLEIIVSARNRLYVFNHNGEFVEGWPQVTDSRIMYSPSVADIDNDGRLDIIAGGADLNCVEDSCKIYVWDKDGTLKLDLPIDIYIYEPPAIGDLDNDGDKEIIVGGRYPNELDPYGNFEHMVYVFENTGELLWEWKDSWYNQLLFFTPAIGDINNDGFLEVIFGVSHNGNGPWRIEVYSHDGDFMHYYYAGYFHDMIPSLVLLSDIDGDSQPEIIGGYGDLTDPQGVLWAWNIEGSLVEGWPVYSPDSNPPQLNEGHFMGPVVGDINGDNEQDIITASMYHSPHIYAYDRQAQSLEGWPKDSFSSLPAIPPGMQYVRTNIPILADVDNDGDIEVILGKEKKFFIWDLAEKYNPSTMEWPQFLHDERHTSNYNSQCNDKTFVGECSYVKPRYCDASGNLLDNYCYGYDQIVGTSDDCGCPPNQECKINGNCIIQRKEQIVVL